MARPLRLEFSGAVYHITARGNACELIFTDDRDRRCFVDFFAREIEQQGCVDLVASSSRGCAIIPHPEKLRIKA